MGVTALGVVYLLGLGTIVPVDSVGDRLYGSVRTESGETVEGWLRWDQNDVSASDYLDGLKELSLDVVREAESLDPDFAAAQRAARSIVAFGVRITWDEDDVTGLPTRDGAIRFAHIRSIERVDETTTSIGLTSGSHIRLVGGSSDRGRSMRAVAVTLPDGEERRFGWRQIERVDFRPAPTGHAPPPSERLYGTVLTWSGMELTGPIGWDLDEVVGADVLDGRADGEDHEILFEDIESIDWESDRSALVVLRSGESMELRGTNDVDRENRGIEVYDPRLGRAIVRWSDFQSVRFHDPEVGPDESPVAPVAPDAPIRGTVYAVDGRVIEGSLRWGNDEAAAWELLEGWSGDVRIGIEFGSIRTITKEDEDSATVELRSGRTIRLADTEDVDDRNAGIFVTPPDGRPTRLVRWRDFHRVELTW